MANFSAVSAEVYTILRSFDYVLDLYDEKSNKVYEPADARKFFASRTSHGKVQNLLVVVEDLNESSVIQLNTGPSSDAIALSGMWESIKTCATKYNMTYALVTHDKEIHPKNFAHNSTMQEGRAYMTDLTENMYGTSRSSYLRIGEAKMIVRHNKRIDADVPGARKRCVEHIFIENAQGERHMMPTNDLAAGRAMGQHINQGGSWADGAADAINSMAGYFSDLGSSSSYLGSAAIMEDCAPLREKCRARRKAIRESFNRMYNESTYQAESASLIEAANSPLLEGANLDSLREQMTIEGRKLPENVLNACARVLAEDNALGANVLDEEVHDDEVRDENEVSDEAQADATISVLGVEINTAAWEKLKDGNIDLRTTPNLANLPRFKSVTAQLMFKMHSLTSVVVDDTLCKLLDKVYDDYVSDRMAKSPQTHHLVSLLAIKVCKAANIQITTESQLGPRGVSAILEMEEWFATFDPARVLLESDCKRDAEDCESDSDALDDCEDEVKKLKGELKDEKKVAETAMFEDDEFGDEEDDDVTESRLAEMFSSQFMDKDGALSANLDEELTQEDILIPKNQGLDLADEVVAEPEDSAEMSRILSLAGRPQATPLGEGDDEMLAELFRAEPAAGNYMGDKYNVVDPSGRVVAMGLDKSRAEASARFKNAGKPFVGGKGGQR